MKVSRNIRKKVGDKEYYRYTVDLPPVLVQLLDWQKDTPLKFEVEGKKLILVKSK
jgi:hypothetical protein